MTPVVPQPPAVARRSLEMLYKPVRAELEEMEARFQRELRSQYPTVDEMVRYGCMLGGKRLRPALMLLVAKAVGSVRREHIVLATVVEMIHTATLIHDDVLDGADVRRHLPTVNQQWDNKASILLGDFLFTHAFYLASTLETTFACRKIGESTNRVCEGEIRQNHSCTHWDLSEAEYLSIVDAKTAELCACACLLGAHYAGADPELAGELEDYGRWLGIAFQVVDDILDVAGDESKMGKSLGTDLDQQKPTLPWIHLWQSASEQERDTLRRIVDSGENVGSRLLPWLERYEAIEYARQYARQLAERASSVAARLPESDAQRVLAALPQFVVQRVF